MAVSVLIGIPCRETAPSSAFYDCLDKLERPAGAVVYQARTGVIPGCRNRICREALKVGAEWVWMLDDDQLFAPEALNALLAHSLDVVIGLTLRRKSPFMPLIYDALPDGQVYQKYLNPGDGGVIEIGGAGMGGCLIRRAVLEAMADPWFTFVTTVEHPDDYCEDFPFYQSVRDAGFKVHCDLDVNFGHTVTSIVWPVRNPDGQWLTVLAEDQPFIAMPQPVSPLAVVPVKRPERKLVLA